jgi:hypothetical protein
MGQDAGDAIRLKRGVGSQLYVIVLTTRGDPIGTRVAAGAGGPEQMVVQSTGVAGGGPGGVFA